MLIVVVSSWFAAALWPAKATLFYRHLQPMKRGCRNHVLVLQPDDLVVINGLECESLQQKAKH